MIKKVIRKAKRCIYCKSLNTIKKGKRKDVLKPKTRYYCKDCKRKFQEKERSKNLNKKVFEQYFWNKKTLSQLSYEFNINRKIIQEIMDNYEVKVKKKK